MNLTVSNLLNYLKNKLDSDASLQNVIVSGEISNYHRHQSGHLYFSLKDDKATISCVMFRYAANNLNFEPKNGDKVLVKANTSIFQASGQLQLYITIMKLDGIGDLFLKFEKLKNNLQAKGYFASEHKREKPLYPMNIAVLVGNASAALSDIKTNFANRWPVAKVTYYPVLVQGEMAAKEIISTLKYVDTLNYDAIILARGGGSFEDLFVFNDEILAYTIYELNTFIITGIGHEQDYTIADFVADLRAPTPTGAVVYLTPDIKEVDNMICDFERRIRYIVNNRLNQENEKFKHLMSSRIFTVDKYLIQDCTIKLEFLKTKLYNNIKGRYQYKESLFYLDNKLKQHMLKKISKSRQLIDIDQLKLKQIMTLQLSLKRNLLKRFTILLDAYSFESVLKRGYSLVLKDDKVIKRKADMTLNEDYYLKMYDGTISVTYKEDLKCQKKNSKTK